MASDYPASLRIRDLATSIGSRIRARRLEMKISQAALAAAVGVSFHEFTRYEEGASLVSTQRLFLVADALQVQLSYFFG